MQAKPQDLVLPKTLRQEAEVMTKIQIRVDQNPEILIATEANLDQANKYNAGTVGKQVTLEGNAKVLRRRMKMILLSCNRRGT